MNREKTRAKSRYRRLAGEQLEGRLMLAADALFFQNPVYQLDVNNDNHISPADALTIIDQLNGLEQDFRSFSDTSGDELLTPIDALKVITEINDPEDMSGSAIGQFELLAGNLSDFPEQIAEHWSDVSAQINSTLSGYREVESSLHQQLSEFLEFDSENMELLQLRLEEIGRGHEANELYLERQIVELSTDVGEVVIPTDPGDGGPVDPGDGGPVDPGDGGPVDPGDGGPVDPGDPGDGGPVDPTDPIDVDFYTDVDWGSFADPSAGFDQLMERIEEVGVHVELPSTEELDQLVDQLAGAFGDHAADLADYVEDIVGSSEVEQWLLDDGDVGGLVDALDGEVSEASEEFHQVVDQYFEDEAAFVEYVEEISDDLVVGELVVDHGDGGDGEDVLPTVITAADENWTIATSDDSPLDALIDSYAGEAVVVDGSVVVNSEENVLDATSIILVGDIQDLANDLAQIDTRLANILLDLLD